MAVVGENGAGKSTVLQCAASIYLSDPALRKEGYASGFFPDTPWDRVKDAEIGYSVWQGTNHVQQSIRKPTNRWRGNPERPKRHIEYIDLSRIQPVSARVGYYRLANPVIKEIAANPFGEERLSRYNAIMGRTYDLAKMATTSADANRQVPVIVHLGAEYSGFHQGAGETTIAELLQFDIPKYSLVLIDEIESSLHPRVQRRLIRDLADLCRERELQVILTTHSPYVLEELPSDARAYIIQSPTGEREIIYGVSPEFAMTKMDDAPHYECDVYVEDDHAKTMLVEALVKYGGTTVMRCRITPYGSSSVGQALGQMVAGKRFPRPSCVFLDGDSSDAVGCLLLPGQDAPERVVFAALHDRNWEGLSVRVGRLHSQVSDACSAVMNFADHHVWVSDAASRLLLGGNTLWQAMCAEWADNCLAEQDGKAMAQAVQDAIDGIASMSRPTPSVVKIENRPKTTSIELPDSSSEQPPLF
jgi:predicted ATPase